VLAIPDTTVHRTKLADWLELNALSSSDGRIGFGTLVSASDLSKEDQPEDIAEDDTSDEVLVLSVQSEIEWRRKLIGADYPFRIDDKGQSMQLSANITATGAAYLLCLFLSHAKDRTIIPKGLAPKITNKVRDLFQACATVAAGGFVQGTAISFGWPRPNKSNFLKALHRVYQLFGDGTPVKRPRPAASKAVKDDGIDVIAWRPSIDGLPGTQYLLGQVASGADWVDKSVVADSKHFHKYWFESQPSCQHQDAMFMPFCLEPVGTDPQRATRRSSKTTCKASATAMGMCSTDIESQSMWRMECASTKRGSILLSASRIFVKSQDGSRTIEKGCWRHDEDPPPLPFDLPVLRDVPRSLRTP
jgi:hypothetical protein